MYYKLLYGKIIINLINQSHQSNQSTISVSTIITINRTINIFNSNNIYSLIILKHLILLHIFQLFFILSYYALYNIMYCSFLMTPKSTQTSRRQWIYILSKCIKNTLSTGYKNKQSNVTIMLTDIREPYEKLICCFNWLLLWKCSHKNRHNSLFAWWAS